MSLRALTGRQLLLLFHLTFSAGLSHDLPFLCPPSESTQTHFSRRSWCTIRVSAGLGHSSSCGQQGHEVDTAHLFSFLIPFLLSKWHLNEMGASPSFAGGEEKGLLENQSLNVFYLLSTRQSAFGSFCLCMETETKQLLNLKFQSGSLHP